MTKSFPWSCLKHGSGQHFARALCAIFNFIFADSSPHCTFWSWETQASSRKSSAYLQDFHLPVMMSFPTPLTQLSPPNPLWNRIQVLRSPLPPRWRTRRCLLNSPRQSCCDSGSTPVSFHGSQSSLLGQSPWAALQIKTKTTSVSQRGWLG